MTSLQALARGGGGVVVPYVPGQKVAVGRARRARGGVRRRAARSRDRAPRGPVAGHARAPRSDPGGRRDVHRGAHERRLGGERLDPAPGPRGRRALRADVPGEDPRHVERRKRLRPAPLRGGEDRGARAGRQRRDTSPPSSSSRSASRWRAGSRRCSSSRARPCSRRSGSIGERRAVVHGRVGRPRARAPTRTEEAPRRRRRRRRPRASARATAARGKPRAGREGRRPMPTTAGRSPGVSGCLRPRPRWPRRRPRRRGADAICSTRPPSPSRRAPRPAPSPRSERSTSSNPADPRRRSA
jgi:hypothetical protein